MASSGVCPIGVEFSKNISDQEMQWHLPFISKSNVTKIKKQKGNSERKVGTIWILWYFGKACLSIMQLRVWYFVIVIGSIELLLVLTYWWVGQGSADSFEHPNSNSLCMKYARWIYVPLSLVISNVNYQIYKL